jgi:hypothetical protein
VADALILKEFIRPVAKLTALRVLSASGVMPLPVGDLLVRRCKLIPVEAHNPSL